MFNSFAWRNTCKRPHIILYFITPESIGSAEPKHPFVAIVGLKMRYVKIISMLVNVRDIRVLVTTQNVSIVHSRTDQKPDVIDYEMYGELQLLNSFDIFGNTQ